MTQTPREVAEAAKALCLKIGKYLMVCKKGQYGCEEGAFETCDCVQEPEPHAYQAICEALTSGRDGWRICSVCGDSTDTVCSDCRINYRTTVYVCGKRECRAHHESKCYGDGDLRADLARMKAALEKCREALGISTGYVFEELLNEIDAALKGTSP